MRDSFRTRRILILIFSLVFGLGAALPRSQAVDWQAEYDTLKAKIEKEQGQPQSGGWASKVIDEYIKWLGIKAGDRAKAAGLAAQAQTAENPYWAKMFTDLQELAQESGDETLRKGAYIFMRVRSDKSGRGPDSWDVAVFRAGPTVGQRLYRAAEQDKFDREIVRDAATCLMRWANRDIEFGYTGLYDQRSGQWGDLDAQGNVVVPQGNFNIECESREKNHVQKEGEPLRNADEAMAMCEKIRDTCDFYGLAAERKDTTDLMEQYLKEKKVLCEMPPGKGHGFFKKLAEQYDLPKAKEYIEGFYAKLKGKVEIENEGKKEPAPGAVVTVTDNEDKRTWKTTADKDGKYEIEDVILHKNCSPFDITADYQGYTEEDSYDGPLEEPDKNEEYEKNLLIEPFSFEGTIEYRWAAKSAKGESLMTTILPGGEYEGTENWRLWVKLKKDRGNENVEVFALSSARLELFEEKLDATVMDMRKEDRSIKVDMKDSATARFRTLSPKECGLELAVNLKKNTYVLSGSLNVKGIPRKSQSSMDMVRAPVDHREKDSDSGTTDIRQSIEFAGSLAADAPENVRGTKDLMQDLTPDAKKFLESMGGKQTSVIRWDLVKRKKK
jgi:hypothetical protein